MEVPVVKQQVDDSALPGARVGTDAPLAAFGGGAAADQVYQAAGQAAGTVQDWMAKAKAGADELAIQDADLAASKLQTKLELDAKGLHGKDALTAPDVVNKGWTDGVEQIKQGLGNQNQVAAFDRIQKQRYDSLYKTAQYHVADEMGNYDTQQTQAYMDQAKNEAVLNYTDPQRVDLSVYQQQQALARHLDRMGIADPTMRKEAYDDAASKTYSAVVQRYLANGQDQSAKAFYDQKKNFIQGPDAATLDKALEEGSIRGESQRQAATIVGQAKGMTDALEAAKKISDPQVQDATVKRVEDYYHTQKLAEDEARDQAFQGLANMAEQTKNPDQVHGQPDWMKLNVAERNAIDSRIKQLRDGVEPSTDWGKYYGLRTMAVSDKNDFIKTNMMLYRTKLADPEFKELVHLQTELKAGRGKEEVDGYRTTDQVLKESLRAVGIDPSAKKGTTAATQVEQASRQLDVLVAQYQQANNGRKPGAVETQKMTDQMLTQFVTKKGWFFDTKKRAFELGGQDAVVVPADDRAKATDALRRANLAPTEENIQRLYKQKSVRESAVGK